MRGLAKLGGRLSLKGSMEFYSPWKENKVHTRLGLETIKVSGIDLKRQGCSKTPQQTGKEAKRARTE